MIRNFQGFIYFHFRYIKSTSLEAALTDGKWTEGKGTEGKRDKRANGQKSNWTNEWDKRENEQKY